MIFNSGCKPLKREVVYSGAFWDKFFQKLTFSTKNKSKIVYICLEIAYFYVKIFWLLYFCVKLGKLNYNKISRNKNRLTTNSA